MGFKFKSFLNCDELELSSTRIISSTIFTENINCFGYKHGPKDPQTFVTFPLLHRNRLWNKYFPNDLSIPNAAFVIFQNHNNGDFYTYVFGLLDRCFIDEHQLLLFLKRFLNFISPFFSSLNKANCRLVDLLSSSLNRQNKDQQTAWCKNEYVLPIRVSLVQTWAALGTSGNFSLCFCVFNSGIFVVVSTITVCDIEILSSNIWKILFTSLLGF